MVPRTGSSSMHRGCSGRGEEKACLKAGWVCHSSSCMLHSLESKGVTWLIDYIWQRATGGTASRSSFGNSSSSQAGFRALVRRSSYSLLRCRSGWASGEGIKGGRTMWERSWSGGVWNVEV